MQIELAWANPTLVVLNKWLSYRGGSLSRFDCIKPEITYFSQTLATLTFHRVKFKFVMNIFCTTLNKRNFYLIESCTIFNAQNFF